MSEPGTFVMTPRGWATLGRCVPALVAVPATGTGRPLVAATALVLAVWSDVLVVQIARRFHWPATLSTGQLDALVDCVSFVAVPAMCVLALVPGWTLLAGVLVFVAAGLFRLARFQAEGLVQGGYRGMPVTYNGYLFPAAIVVIHVTPTASPLWWYVPLLLSAGLMVGTFIVPEF